MVTFPILPKVDCNKTPIKVWLDTFKVLLYLYFTHFLKLYDKRFSFLVSHHCHCLCLQSEHIMGLHFKVK